MKPLPKDFWPERFDVTLEHGTRGQIEAAWANWPGGKSWGLSEALQAQGVEPSNQWWGCVHLAGEVLHMARSAGYIEFRNGNWHWIGK